MPEHEENTTYLRLKNMSFWGRHGHHDFERQSGNRFEVDVELKVDLSALGKSDRLEKTVDLEEVYRIIRLHVEGDPRNLIETVAGNIAEEIGKNSKIKSCTVRLRKVHPPLPGAVHGAMEVEITHVP